MLQSDSLHEYIGSILAAVTGGNAFLRALYNANLFLGKAEAGLVASHGRQLLEGYMKAASLSYSLGYTRFKLIPKVHMLAHFVLLMEEASRTRTWCLSPLSYSCQMDEDLVGRCSAMSRTSSIRTVHQRTLRKYLVNVKFHLQQEPRECKKALRAEPSKRQKLTR